MINFAKQNGEWVEVYDDRNCLIWKWSGKLVGYTSNSVSIQRNDGSVGIYDSRGTLQSVR